MDSSILYSVPRAQVNLKQLAQRTLQDLHDSGMNPPFKPSPHPKMPDIQVSTQGIEKLLKGLKPNKAAGPDKFKSIVLQALHIELAPILQLMYQNLLTRVNSYPSGKRQTHPLSSKKGIKLTQQIIDQIP